jgi:manganese/iron transport system permease protein
MSQFVCGPFELPFMQRALIEILLLSALSAAVGVFILVRRLEFMADALTHTVFPGVVVGYLIGEEPGILTGALVFGLLSAAMFTYLVSGSPAGSKNSPAPGRQAVGPDAALAILLTSFFAVGVVLVSRRSSYTADLTVFLFGRILTVDRSQIRQTVALAVLVGLVLLAVRKELILRAFDPIAAQALGYRVGYLDLLLNLVIALVVVAAVQAVGTVLVIALIVVPITAARLLTDHLIRITLLATTIGMTGGWAGLMISYQASVQHGVRLAAGGCVVLVLVGGYVICLAVRTLRAAAVRR